MNTIYKYSIILLLLMQIGCANNTLIYQQKDFKPSNLDVITVLPASDARRIAYETVNFNNETSGIQLEIIEKLKRKGYKTIKIPDINVLGNISPAQIPFLDADSFKKIDIKDGNWILFPVVVALKNFMGSTTKYVEVVCYLYEKHTGKLVWEGSARHTYIYDATTKLINKFPSKQ